ncbi:MAG: metallophosphoesterase [Promethearchaeota archaeon]
MAVKIFACGDIHADYDLLSRFVEEALEREVQLLIFAGDICNGRKLPCNTNVLDFIIQAEPITKILAEIAFPIFFVLGNHDPIALADELTRYPQIKDIHGKQIEWNGYRIGGIGGSHYVTRQLQSRTIPFPEGNFPYLFDNTDDFEHLRTIHSNNSPYIYSGVHLLYNKIFPCDVLITHTPPLLPERENFYEASVGLYKLITRFRPLLNISAHVHEPKSIIEEITWEKRDYNATTTLINLGSLRNKQICLISLSRDEKSIEQIEVEPIE